MRRTDADRVTRMRALTDERTDGAAGLFLATKTFDGQLCNLFMQGDSTRVARDTATVQEV